MRKSFYPLFYFTTLPNYVNSIILDNNIFFLNISFKKEEDRYYRELSGNERKKPYSIRVEKIKI